MPDQLESDAATQLFPRTVHFKRADASCVFASAAELGEFLSREQALWAPIDDRNLSQPAAAIARNQRELIRPDRFSEDENYVRDLIVRMEESFFPLSFGKGRVLHNFFIHEREVGAASLVMIMEPKAHNFNTQAAVYAPAQALRIVVQLLGTSIDSQRDLEEKKSKLEWLTAHASDLRATYSAHIDEGRLAIETIATQAALKAPREYWNKRKEDHKERSISARKSWISSTMLFCLVMIIAVISAFSPFSEILLPRSTSDSGWIAALVSRALFVGTIAGVGVWVLKQLLRDVRNHEHLAEDAAERVTMIETLSALQAMGLKEGDLSTILSALYRPAASAMADDGGPVLPIEILMKGVADAASRARS